jgi:hypothetical protein
LTGPQGNVGPQGTQGLTGPQGPQGITGLTGLTGPAGATGPRGATGAQGPQGIQGLAGPDNDLQTTAVRSTLTTIGPSAVGTSTATCPEGTVVTGGGMRLNDPGNEINPSFMTILIMMYFIHCKCMDYNLC